MGKQHQEAEIIGCYRYTVIRFYDENPFTEYHVYQWRDRYHRRQLAKVDGILSAIRVIYNQILNGG